MNQPLVDNLEKIKSSLPTSITLVAVSKTKPISDIEILYQAGQRIFGENRVEELVEKQAALPKDIEWHMIGHLQSKKVKKITPFISLIHGVDSMKLLQEIDKQGKKNERVIDCLLQFHIANEETKYGLNLNEFNEFLAIKQFDELTNISIKGVMGMATFTQDQAVVREEFQSLTNISNIVKKQFPDAAIISMGMSGDYKLAIEEGSTMIRVGSSIFGVRK
jgi:pyridoxal phosphate enzyme (YggS family)